MKEVIENTTDLEIVTKVKQGDADAFGELMNRYSEKLTRYLRRFLQDENSVTDVLQDVLVKAYINIQSFDEQYSFSSWIYRIAHNEAINVIKKKKSTPFSWFEPEALVPYFVERNTVVETIDKESLKKELDIVLKKLSPTYREILTLAYYEELSYKEIALVLKIPISSVGVRINRAKKKALLLTKDGASTIHEYYT